MEPCRFCRIIQETEPATVILRTGGAVAFFDICPVNPGHTLVIPRRHVSAFTQLEIEEVSSLTMAVQQVAASLKLRLPNCVGVTLSLADGEGAGQEVSHAHFHVIPRYQDDGFGWRRFGQLADRENLESLAALVRTSAVQASHQP
jgi:histidine triad (HIT) family protein